MQIDDDKLQVQSLSMISKRKEGKLNTNSIAKKLVSMQLDTALLAPIVKMEDIDGTQKCDERNSIIVMQRYRQTLFLFTRSTHFENFRIQGRINTEPSVTVLQNKENKSKSRTSQVTYENAKEGRESLGEYG